MTDSRSISAQQFADRKLDLPEAGRWHELHDGRIKLLSGPDDIHGTIVLNLSRALAQWLHSQPLTSRGYACPDIGLHVKSDPDTVYVPAISYFCGGQPFSQFDRVVASEVPKLVIDIASSTDRRQDMRLRSTSYLQLGAEEIWIPDPFKKEFQIIRRGSHTLALGTWQWIENCPLLPGFRMEVEKVFAQPRWWDGRLPDFTIVDDESKLS